MASTTRPSGGPLNRPTNKRQKMVDLQQSIKDILTNTNWPKDAAPEAERFSQSLNTGVDVESMPENDTNIPADLLSAIESTICGLEDVHRKLRIESNNHQDNRKSLWRSIKEFSHKGECKDLLRDYRKAVEANFGALKVELLKLGGPGGSSPISITPQPTHRPPNQPPKSPADNNGSWRENILGPTKSVFKAASALSGAIPVAGSYIGGVATFGLTCIEMVEGMDQNDETVKSLGIHINALSKTLEKVKAPERGEQDQVMHAIKELHANLEEVRSEIQRLQSGTAMRRFWSAEKDAGTLKKLQDQVRAALEEIQLLASLNTSLLVDELRDATQTLKINELLQRLGDGKYGARGNVDEEVQCFPGTRVKVLEHVDDWMRRRDAKDKVLWIHGMAGRGKSTIASTVEAIWRQRAVCALFHFRRGQNSFDSRLICSLAKQLARGIDIGLRDRILANVRKNEDIVDARLNVQFKELLVDTLAAVNDKPYPVLIVIDALDECDTPNYAIAFIKLIKTHLSDFPNNVKILLTSRPELSLLRELRPSKWKTEDLDSDQVAAEQDIQRYLLHELVEVRASQSLPMTWPSEEVVLKLSQMSQGLFQWARTLTMFIREGEASWRLKEVLDSPGEWNGVDELYTQILSRAVTNLAQSKLRAELFLPVLGTILAATRPLSLEEIAFLHADTPAITGVESEDVVRLLRGEVLSDLNSLLFVPETSRDPVLLMHTSIRDLLLDRDRCKNTAYWVNAQAVHECLATTCLKRMMQHLRQNIADLRDISKPLSELGSITQRNIPAGLPYCCQSWSIHLQHAWTERDSPTKGWETLQATLRSFSEGKALFWLEVMILMGWIREAISVAKQAETWLSLSADQRSASGTLSALWNDMHRFITAFWETISFNPLQIYVSALAHCPQRTALWEKYQGVAKVPALGGHDHGWSSELWTRTTEIEVWEVSFSPDGLILAVACGDGIIQLWNTQSGIQMGEPLTGHDGSVSSVSFSPTGTLLVSGSSDVRFWDVESGNQVGEPLTGHDDWVCSVRFSPNGELVASGSSDHTIRLWDAKTREQVGQPWTGHEDRVSSVNFSPDGKLVASASDDCTVRLWNTSTGSQVGEPFAGHESEVNSVVFSSDGRLVASGSNDETVRLWDTQTGVQVGEPFTGSTGHVFSVSLSPQSNLVAAVSMNGTIRLWDSNTRNTVHGPWTNHMHQMNSVAFSPDGTLLASGTFSATIHLWDATIGTEAGPHITGHEERVNSTSFSPDGKLLASCSDDKTVRLWDTQTGTQVGKPMTGHDHWVVSVHFSPDGKLIASTSYDKTIRLWATETRTQVHEPLTGHTSCVHSTSFSPDSKLLVSGSSDNTIRLWDTQTGTQVGNPIWHERAVYEVNFSPDGKVVAYRSIDNTIRLWDVETRAPVGEPLRGHEDRLSSMGFSPDGKLFATGSLDRTVRLWDTKTGAQVGEPLQDDTQPDGLDRPHSVTFSTHSDVITASYSMGSASWNVNSRQKLDQPVDPLLVKFRLEEKWLAVQPSRIIWFPSEYWEGSCLLHRPTQRLVAQCGDTISFFDISRLLEPSLF